MKTIINCPDNATRMALLNAILDVAYIRIRKAPVGWNVYVTLTDEEFAFVTSSVPNISYSFEE